MKRVQLIEAHETDIPLIARLAKIIWNQHYPSIISQEQINYMLNWMYSADSLTEQLHVKKHRFFLIRQNNEPIGFLSVHHEQQDNWFLNKFYIDQQQSAKGIGSEAFDLLLEILKAKKMSLTVNRQNFKSVNFYFKKGFKIERVADFDIGNGYVMNDFVMVWNAIHH